MWVRPLTFCRQWSYAKPSNLEIWWLSLKPDNNAFHINCVSNCYSWATTIRDGLFSMCRKYAFFQQNIWPFSQYLSDTLKGILHPNGMKCLCVEHMSRRAEYLFPLLRPYCSVSFFWQFVEMCLHLAEHIVCIIKPCVEQATTFDFSSYVMHISKGFTES